MLCDEFIFLDHVQFSKGSYTNRCLMPRTSATPTFLTVPLARDAYKQPIQSLIPVANEWTVDHHCKIVEWLEGYRYFSDLEDILECIKKAKGETLAMVNIKLIKLISRKLQIESDVIISSQMEPKHTGSDMIANLVERVKGNCYVTGVGFKNYYNNSTWPEDIQIKLVDFSKLFMNSDLSKFSIIENIARLGIDKVRLIMQELTRSDQLKNMHENIR